MVGDDQLHLCEILHFDAPTVTNVTHAYLEEAFVLVCYATSNGK